MVMATRYVGLYQRVSIFGCCLALVAGCFSGGFAQGLPCAKDDDCGPELLCTDGLCGGRGDPALCGNGLLDVDEECDDGNLEEDDGCSATCQLPPMCGNGRVEAGEECDDGNDVDADACSVDCVVYPKSPSLKLTFAQVKQFEFAWESVQGAQWYELYERAEQGGEFVHVGGKITGESHTLVVPLHFRIDASYKLRACNPLRCAESPEVSVTTSLTEAIGYFKASNPESYDYFGSAVAVAGDGRTLAIGALLEASGTHADSQDNSEPGSGAVYIFTRVGEQWMQEAYIKAANAGGGDVFGMSVVLSNNGDTLVVGASQEDGGATGVNSDDLGFVEDSGAAYVFTRVDNVWTQQAYVKASNTGWGDAFGSYVALSADGNTLAVGAPSERSRDTGSHDANQLDNSFQNAGAVYVFTRTSTEWMQQAYIKASNTGDSDGFGTVQLSHDGSTLVVGAPSERSGVGGVNSAGQEDDSTEGAGAVYVFRQLDDGWEQEAYIKAPTPYVNDYFGSSVALSGDGDTLAISANLVSETGAVYVYRRVDKVWAHEAYLMASNAGEGDLFGQVAISGDGSALVVGASSEDSRAVGLNGDMNDDFLFNSGAAYLFVRRDGGWQQKVYIKGPLAASSYYFGSALAISNDGEIIAIGSPFEGGGAMGIGGQQADDSQPESGAVYVY